MARLTHTDESGKAKMVNVGEKEPTRRRAAARGEVLFGEEAFRLLRENRLEKGDALDHLDVAIELTEPNRAVVTAVAEARWPTGVEMEALVAVSCACLTLYDMVKGVDRGIRISEIHLLEKSGGRSGAWKKGEDS